jgi:hypothetical protein
MLCYLILGRCLYKYGVNYDAFDAIMTGKRIKN